MRTRHNGSRMPLHVEPVKMGMGNHPLRAKSDDCAVAIHADLCKGCLLCIEVCPPEVLAASEKLNQMGYRPAEYQGHGCTGCGVCFYVCPEPAAITVFKRG